MLIFIDLERPEGAGEAVGGRHAGHCGPPLQAERGLSGWRWQAVPHPLRLSTKAPCYWGLEAEVPISRVIAELIGQLGGSCPTSPA